MKILYPDYRVYYLHTEMYTIITRKIFNSINFFNTLGLVHNNKGWVLRQGIQRVLRYKLPIDAIYRRVLLHDNMKGFNSVDHKKWGKFLKRWEYQNAFPVSWEICMQVKNNS